MLNKIIPGVLLIFIILSVLYMILLLIPWSIRFAKIRRIILCIMFLLLLLMQVDLLWTHGISLNIIYDIMVILMFAILPIIEYLLEKEDELLRKNYEEKQKIDESNK